MGACACWIREVDGMVSWLRFCMECSFESDGEGGDGFGCLWVKFVAGVDAISYKSFTMLKKHGKRCYGDAASGRIQHSLWVSYS